MEQINVTAIVNSTAMASDNSNENSVLCSQVIGNFCYLLPVNNSISYMTVHLWFEPTKDPWGSWRVFGQSFLDLSVPSLLIFDKYIAQCMTEINSFKTYFAEGCTLAMRYVLALPPNESCNHDNKNYQSDIHISTCNFSL